MIPVFELQRQCLVFIRRSIPVLVFLILCRELKVLFYLLREFIIPANEDPAFLCCHRRNCYLAEFCPFQNFMARCPAQFSMFTCVKCNCCPLIRILFIRICERCCFCDFCLCRRCHIPLSSLISCRRFGSYRMDVFCFQRVASVRIPLAFCILQTAGYRIACFSVIKRSVHCLEGDINLTAIRDSITILIKSIIQL